MPISVKEEFGQCPLTFGQARSGQAVGLDDCWRSLPTEICYSIPGPGFDHPQNENNTIACLHNFLQI